MELSCLYNQKVAEEWTSVSLQVMIKQKEALFRLHVFGKILSDGELLLANSNLTRGYL